MLSRSLWCCSSNLRSRIDIYYFFCVANNKFSESVGALQNQLTCQNGKDEMKGFQHEQKTIKIDLLLKSMLRRRTSSLPSVCPASWYLEQSHIFTDQLIISTRNYQVPRTLKMWHRTQQQHSHPQSNPNVTYFLQNLKILFLTFFVTLKKLIFSFLFFYISIFFLSFLYLFSSLCAFLLSVSFSFLSPLPSSFFLLIFCFSHYACSLSLSLYAFSFHGNGF